MPELQGVSPHDPSSAQRATWGAYVIWESGPDGDGWWLGWCPVHDSSQGDIDAPSAQFSFSHGSLRCMGNPANGMGLPCHAPTRAVSFQNALSLMVNRG